MIDGLHEQLAAEGAARGARETDLLRWSFPPNGTSTLDRQAKRLATPALRKRPLRSPRAAAPLERLRLPSPTRAGGVRAERASIPP